MIEKVEKGIASKRVRRNEAKGEITIVVVFQTPTRNNGIVKKIYTQTDARRRLEEGGIKVDSCSSGGRVSNRDSTNAGTNQTGSWTFKVWVEPEVPVVESVPARKAKVVAIKESTSTNKDEFEGLNFDGGTTQTKKASAKRKSPRKRK